MKEVWNWVLNNWQFLVGEILVPFITFILGIFVGVNKEKRKYTSKAIIKNDSDNNCIIQNSNVDLK